MRALKVTVHEVERDVLVRATISFPDGIYETLGQIARQKKVSLAWVVRDAAERYIGRKFATLANRE